VLQATDIGYNEFSTAHETKSWNLQTKKSTQVLLDTQITKMEGKIKKWWVVIKYDKIRNERKEIEEWKKWQNERKVKL
jgi:hypothetical protein